MRICILGAGGLGSIVGGYLALADAEVTMIGRPAHVQAIAAQGLRITGLRGDRTVTRNLVAVEHARAAIGQFDYLIVAVKAKDTETALADATALRERTDIALSLQNTVCKERELAAWIGPDRVLGASTTEAGILLVPGTVRHVATAPTASYFGEPGGGSSPRVDALVEIFNAAGIASQAADDISHVEWEKLLQISVVASWSVSTFGALGGSMADGLLIHEAAEHYVQIASELFEVYRAMGYEARDFFAPFSQFRRLADSTFEESVERMMELGRSMRAQGVVGRPSLHDDLLRGQRTEVDFCIGAFLDQATKHEVRVPTVRAAYRMIKSLEFWIGLKGGVEVSPLPVPPAGFPAVPPPTAP